MVALLVWDLQLSLWKISICQLSILTDVTCDDYRLVMSASFENSPLWQLSLITCVTFDNCQLGNCNLWQLILLIIINLLTTISLDNSLLSNFILDIITFNCSILWQLTIVTFGNFQRPKLLTLLLLLATECSLLNVHFWYLIGSSFLFDVFSTKATKI